MILDSDIPSTGIFPICNFITHFFCNCLSPLTLHQKLHGLRGQRAFVVVENNMNEREKATLSLITVSLHFSSKIKKNKKPILSTKNLSNLPNRTFGGSLCLVCRYKTMKHMVFVLNRTSYVLYWSLLSELCGRYVQSAVLLRLWLMAVINLAS